MKRFRIMYKPRDASVKEKVAYIHEVDKNDFMEAVEYGNKFAKGNCMDESVLPMRNDDHSEYRVVLIAEVAQVI